jgi:hypothetical protein
LKTNSNFFLNFFRIFFSGLEQGKKKKLPKLQSRNILNFFCRPGNPNTEPNPTLPGIPQANLFFLLCTGHSWTIISEGREGRETEGEKKEMLGRGEEENGREGEGGREGRGGRRCWVRERRGEEGEEEEEKEEEE